MTVYTESAWGYTSTDLSAAAPQDSDWGYVTVALTDPGVQVGSNWGYIIPVTLRSPHHPVAVKTATGLRYVPVITKTATGWA